MSGTQETALTLARELSGAGEAEEALLELLCQAAEQQWEKRLRPGMTTEDCGKAFPCAVAFTAAADLAVSSAVVTGDGSDEALKKAVADAGYTVTDIH